MGYFYHDSFDPSQPEQNLVLEDDDSGDDENNFYQFRIEAFLEAERIYYLVITTHGEHEKGDFSIVVDGAEAVDLTPFTATTSQPITAGKLIPYTSLAYSIYRAFSADIGSIFKNH